MRNIDDFDDSRARGAIASIFGALNIAGRIKARGPLFIVAPVVLMAVIAAGVLWYSYPKEVARQELRAVPIIRADASDWKEAPQDPGGMDIPWKDSTVFDTLRAARADGKPSPVENLLPPPEQPMERTAMFAGTKTALDDSAEAVAPVVAAAEVPQEPEEKAAAETAAKTEPAAGDAKAPVVPVEETGGWFVQLGSIRDKSDAAKNWATLQSAFPSLKNLDLRVQEANLGARGTFYRIQGGPVDEAQARAICASFTAKRPGGCLVVPR